jgi:hypothetical protein
MGLDWNPMARPKRGHDKEFVKVFRALERDAPKEGDARLARFREISQAPFETVGAPRVGFDRTANAWLARRIRDKRKRAKAMITMKGYYVLDLLPECDGFPRYTNNGAYDGVDRYSFRAQFLFDCEKILGKRLMALAYKSMLADEVARYGEALDEKARAFAKREGVRIVEGREVAYDESSAESRADIIFAAARWCRYWSKRGHGLEPYY